MLIFADGNENAYKKRLYLLTGLKTLMKNCLYICLGLPIRDLPVVENDPIGLTNQSLLATHFKRLQ
jgi:hypothetical protein